MNVPICRCGGQEIVRRSKSKQRSQGATFVRKTNHFKGKNERTTDDRVVTDYSSRFTEIMSAAEATSQVVIQKLNRSQYLLDGAFQKT